MVCPIVRQLLHLYLQYIIVVRIHFLLVIRIRDRLDYYFVFNLTLGGFLKTYEVIPQGKITLCDKETSPFKSCYPLTLRDKSLTTFIIFIIIFVYFILGGFPFLKGQCHKIFDPRFFSSKHPSWAPDLGANAFSNMNLNSRRYSNFFKCMPCHWHRMHDACSVIDTACTVHAVSVTLHARVHVVSLIPHARCMLCHWHRMYGACGVTDHH
jgi:hypothetical protein